MGLWLMGMTGLIFGTRKLQGHIQGRQWGEAERERLIAELQEALAKERGQGTVLVFEVPAPLFRPRQGFRTAIMGLKAPDLPGEK